MIKYILNRIPVNFLLIYEMDLRNFRVSISKDFHVKLATKKVLCECEFDGTHKKRLVSAIDSKDCCFIVTYHKKIIHHSLVSLNKHYREPVDCTYVCRNGIYIYDCWTDPDYWGRSIYPFVLQYICNHFKENKLFAFIDVWPSNEPSIRGIKKAGFREVSSFIMINIGVLKVIIVPKKLRKYIGDGKQIRIRCNKHWRWLL